MKNPLSKDLTPIEFSRNYFDLLNKSSARIEFSPIRDFIRVIETAHENSNLILTLGNGGSAAIANHFLCDHSKGVAGETNFLPRIVSLSNSNELITAIANDISSDSIFSEQARLIVRPGDVIFAISSSGKSQNIVSAVKLAKERGATVLSLTGFDGLPLRELSDYNIHVPINNYGIVEDIHQSIMHILAQYIRVTRANSAQDIKL